jgi:putative hydrolase
LSAILAVDAQYRKGAEAGELPRIAPRRFNEKGHAWLPILRAERDGWNFNALYSNTARAHQFDRTHDWVVIYYERDVNEGQCTVVTEPRGPLRGKRVVRGREGECREHYRTPLPRPLAEGAGI